MKVLALLSRLRPLLIFAGAVAVSFFLVSSREPVSAQGAPANVPQVRVVEVRRGAVPVTVVVHGNVRALRSLELPARVTGRIVWKSDRFEPGVRVSAGEPLLRIDPTDFRLALAEAQVELASAELALADATALRRDAAKAEASARVEAARARIARAQRDLDSTEVAAPFDAVIDSQLVELEQFVTSGTNLGRILGTARAELRLPVPPQDVVYLQDAGGTPVRLVAEIGPQPRSWEGRLTRIEARVDEETRVFPVVVEVEDPLDGERHGTPLPFGLFVRAELVGQPIPDAALIPRSALHSDDAVYVLVDGALERRAVRVERLTDEGVVVTEGLKDGALVVTTRLDLMYEGLRVSRADG